MADAKPGNASPGAKAKAGAYTPSGVSAIGRRKRSYSIRLWSVRHSRMLEWFYAKFADMFLALHPLWNKIGYGRVEAPIKFVEKRVKGLMFDCRMCGQCVLSSTGMSCPMNCPKQLRNGPCGGVRANGNCEVEPDMPCVWVKAWEGSRNMVHGDKIMDVQKPVDQSLRETSAWLRVTALAAADRDAVIKKDA
ncbi:methylenetetrahydrofolate reductase C-terminal domain-containing protein [Rhizobium sp. TH2]|uniref:methylenetetrahydrofolate reductase C-terminal domain-containing protein n=1 Tax=Rhizobium sp. TH2 TaxID=2775403 RepID=UPI0021578703|nr:methylenetetrahydrofolate reductase C-terminal domain-containing protein [Rhizobium sp. TH2]UVC11607.1 methylenetetrahydrofolate reductase C-terminal domain-containing protein [Rhizobium sp. TH2]